MEYGSAQGRVPEYTLSFGFSTSRRYARAVRRGSCVMYQRARPPHPPTGAQRRVTTVGCSARGSSTETQPCRLSLVVRRHSLVHALVRPCEHE